MEDKVSSQAEKSTMEKVSWKGRMTHRGRTVSPTLEDEYIAMP